MVSQARMKKGTTTVKDLGDLLNRLTNDQPEGGAFLEDSRERELVYSRRSTRRWHEIIQFIESIGPVNRCLDIGTSPLTFALKQYCAQLDTLDISKHFENR